MCPCDLCGRSAPIVIEHAQYGWCQKCVDLCQTPTRLLEFTFMSKIADALTSLAKSQG